MNARQTVSWSGMQGRTVPLFAVAAISLTLSSLLAGGLPEKNNLIQPDPANPGIIDITPVRDQGSLGSCWANAATSAFESSVLKHDLVQKNDDPGLDLSCWHLATHAGDTVREYKPTYDEQQGDYDYSNWAGTAVDAIIYWTRGRGSWPVPGANHKYKVGGGPVAMDVNPLNEYPAEAAREKEDLTRFVPPADEPVEWRLERSYHLLFTHPGALTAGERDEIKEQIMNTSAVITGMHADFSKYFDLKTAIFLYRGGEGANHDVILIGWDDTIRVPGAKHRGAWLVQNSYGVDLDETIRHEYQGLPASDLKGCFWLSYDDTASVKDNFSVEAASWGDFSDIVLENQVFNQEFTVGNSEGGRSKALSVLKGHPPFELGAVGIMNWFPNHHVAVRVYDTLENAKKDDGKTGLLGSAAATPPNDGYATIHFDKPVTIKAAKFYVLLDFGVTQGAPIGVDPRSPRTDGISYFYRDSRWIDLNDNGDDSGIVFLKGLTLK